MAIIKFKEIENLYSQKVCEYINKGYVISSEHTSGSQTGEVVRIALSKGETFIKICLLNSWENWKETIKLVVLKFEKTNEWRTLWNNEAEIVEEKIFFEINHAKKVYSDDKAEFDVIAKKQKERSKNYYFEYDYENILQSEKAKNVAYKLAKKQAGYKSINKKSIEKIVRGKNCYILRFLNKSSLYLRMTND